MSGNLKSVIHRLCRRHPSGIERVAAWRADELEIGLPAT